MSHVSVRPITDDESDLLQSLFDLAISGENQGIAKISSTAFENRTFSGGGGSTVWGSITGTLSDQTDLQTALDAKADLAGDTFTGDISVPDEAYGVLWNGSLKVPTKNAIYDAINAIVVTNVNAYVSQAFTTQTSVNVIHNFGKYPVVQIIDDTGAVIIPLAIVNNTINDFTVTFTTATTGTIVATLGAPQPQAYIEKSANYTILTTDYTVNCTANTFTITLPTAVGSQGRIYNIKNSGTGIITIATTSSQTIDGITTQTLNQYDSIAVQSDGTNWIII